MINQVTCPACGAPLETDEAYCARVKEHGDRSPPGSHDARMAAAIRLAESAPLIDEADCELVVGRLADVAGVEGRVYQLADGRLVHLAVVPQTEEETRRLFVEGVTAHMR